MLAFLVPLGIAVALVALNAYLDARAARRPYERPSTSSPRRCGASASSPASPSASTARAATAGRADMIRISTPRRVFISLAARALDTSFELLDAAKPHVHPIVAERLDAALTVADDLFASTVDRWIAESRSTGGAS